MTHAFGMMRVFEQVAGVAKTPGRSGDSTGVYEERRIHIVTATERARHIVDCASADRRIVIFSGGAAVFDDDKLLDEIRAFRVGGGFGSIIGRNSFHRPKDEALQMLRVIMDIYATAPEPDRTR